MFSRVCASTLTVRIRFIDAFVSFTGCVPNLLRPDHIYAEGMYENKLKRYSYGFPSQEAGNIARTCLQSGLSNSHQKHTIDLKIIKLVSKKYVGLKPCL